MTPVPPATVLDALHWRYATKKFDPSRTIPAETWHALEQALVLSPSSRGLQPWKFLVVRDPALREKLVPISRGQTQPLECSHYVVITYIKDLPDAHIDKYFARMSEVRQVSLESLAGYRKMVDGGIGQARKTNYIDLWQGKQPYIALGQFMAAAAMLGVDTCPMEGIDKEKYDALLGLAEKGLTTLVCCAAGYRSAEDDYAKRAKVRFLTSDVVTYL